MKNLYDNTDDYAHDTYILPAFVTKLIEEGKVGRKAGEGLYKTIIHDDGTKIHQVYDIVHGCYREQIKYNFPFAKEMIAALRSGGYKAAFQTLVENQSVEARLCLEFLLKYIVYSLSITKETGCGISDADDVMAQGFHWCPPLAMMEAISTAANFEELCEQRLEKSLIDMFREQQLVKELKKSDYDFRKFIWAKW